MPKYIVSSEGPITVTKVEMPDRPELPTLPPREEWPDLPPWLGDRLPIPPSPEHPWVPIPEDPEITPPPVWPPLPEIPDLPDLSGKSLVLVRVYISRHVNYLRWVVVDHEAAKEKMEKAIEWLKEHRPQPK